jgi:enoyl-CoA hydratase/carnithine racemase
VSRSGGVAILTLNRPDKRNALDRGMLSELKTALTDSALAADVRVVALRGSGKDFCAGLDLEELLASADLAPEENEKSSMELGDLFLQLRALATSSSRGRVPSSATPRSIAASSPRWS